MGMERTERERKYEHEIGCKRDWDTFTIEIDLQNFLYIPIFPLEIFVCISVKI